ncbi:hybrid sensor histidine kinase/response regulator [Parafrankia discariae]|uniref:hybrid sensor histidine kinase/response regulator n=1 Tax=Parafrankia discariae TaxID=365528 RepID=UPI00038090C7|nr:ATP-binding protein [Parafrankia discariae]
MNGSATATLANAATTAAYLAICLSIARGLWRSGQWRNNPLGLATAAIFFTCAIGHGSHIFQLPHATGPATHGGGHGGGPAGGLGGGGYGEAPVGPADRRLIDVQFLTTAWDVVTATVGVWYWTLRSRFPALVRGTALFEDLRLREATQRTLRESEERYRGIVETTADGVVLLGPDGHITYRNARFAAIVGGTPLGTRFTDLVSDTDRAEITAALDAVRAGAVRRLEIALRHSDSRKVCAQVALTARLGPAGAADGTLAIVTDITEQKNIEAQLRQAQRLDALGQLAGGIAHDFNNLLTVIDGYATLVLARGDLDDGVQRDLTAVRDAAARATGLTTQLLAFSRTVDVSPGPVDLNDLVRGLEEMLRRLIREDIELVVMPSVRPATVRVDRGKLEQVLVNLVVNSRDAMPDGGRLFIRVVVVDDIPAAGRPDAAARRRVRLTVADTGQGMPEHVRARIFEPFFTTKDPGKGTGLGLATVYGIVRQAEGTVEVDSVPGLGATFRVDLPAFVEPALVEPALTEPPVLTEPVRAEPTRAAPSRAEPALIGAAHTEATHIETTFTAPGPAVRPAGGTVEDHARGDTGADLSGRPRDAARTNRPAPVAPASLAGLAGRPDVPDGRHRPDTARPAWGCATILLAEDDDAVRRLAERVLRGAGYRVICAADGRAARTLARRLTSIDLLVTDVILPGRNGRQLAEELTRMFPDLPVVFTSAYSRGMLSDGGGDLGVAYLPKPFTPTSLTETVRAALATRRPAILAPTGSVRLPAVPPAPPQVTGAPAGRHRERRPRRGS